jgi:hypothetical protein
LVDKFEEVELIGSELIEDSIEGFGAFPGE